MDSQQAPPPSPQAEECLVCLNGLDNGNQWTCATCHKQCHMLCIFQWTLRLSLNERRHFSGFTCPGCRSRHSITTLPGFEQQSEPSRERPSRTRNNASTPGDALRRAFGLPSNQSARTGDEAGDGRVLRMVVEEASNEDDSDSDEDDYSDEDDDEDERDRRWVFNISAERMYFDVNTLTVNSR